MNDILRGNTGMITGMIEGRERREILDPAGDQNGYHRRRDRKHWTFERVELVTIDNTQPFDILLSRGKSLKSAGIIFFETVDGVRAWFSHCGQILPGYIVSEACYPYYKRTPLRGYIERDRAGVDRVTIVRIRDEVFGDEATKAWAQEKCLDYHNSIAGIAGPDGDVLKILRNQTGHPYNLIDGLMLMMVMSIIRNSNPFLKRGRWENIPAEYQYVIFICSGILNWGWADFMRAKNVCLFPSSLSLLVPTPQDIWYTENTGFIAGWKKIYTGG